MLVNAISYPYVVVIYEGQGSIQSGPANIIYSEWFSPYKLYTEDYENVIYTAGNIINMVIATSDYAETGCLLFWLRHSNNLTDYWDYPISVIHVGYSAKVVSLQFKAFARYNKIWFFYNVASGSASIDYYLSISARSF